VTTIGNDELKLYEDGAISATVQLTNSVRTDVCPKLRVGQYGRTVNGLESSRVYGKIGNVAVRSRVLTQSEVTALYNAGPHATPTVIDESDTEVFFDMRRKLTDHLKFHWEGNGPVPTGSNITGTIKSQNGIEMRVDGTIRQEEITR
jgi:hypothetical protein